MEIFPFPGLSDPQSNLVKFICLEVSSGVGMLNFTSVATAMSADLNEFCRILMSIRTMSHYKRGLFMGVTGGHLSLDSL